MEDYPKLKAITLDEDTYIPVTSRPIKYEKNCKKCALQYKDCSVDTVYLCNIFQGCNYFKKMK